MGDGQLSADGKWWWNGTQWVAAVSEDGKWRWDGTAWQPIDTPAAAPASAPAPVDPVLPTPSPAASQPLPPPVTAAPAATPGPRRRGVPTWAVVLASLFCFPVGVVLTWLTAWTTRTKVIVSAVVTGLWVAGIVATAINTPQQPSPSPAANVASVASSQPTHQPSPAAGSSHSPSPTAHTPAPAKSPAPAPQVTTHTALTFSGTGYETTQPFKIPTSDWTLSWTLKGDPQYATATFVIYDSNGSRVDSVDASVGSDSSTIHQGNDLFFIEVLVANASYTVTATARYAGPDQTFSIPSMSTAQVFTGDGDKSTPTFHISGSIWVVALQTGAPSEYTSVAAYVYKSDGSEVEELSVEGAQGGQETISYVYSGPGDYYLKFLVANTSFTATVEQTSA